MAGLTSTAPKERRQAPSHPEAPEFCHQLGIEKVDTRQVASDRDAIAIDTVALGRVMREAPIVTSVNLSFDQNQREVFYAAIKAVPAVGRIARRCLS